MYNAVKQNIFKENLICEGDNILLGFSGGPDSVFLFHNLRILSESLKFNLCASHINHMYRGEHADHDENFVRELCERYGVKLFVKRKNAAEYAEELKLTEEEAGRLLRYNFFRENLKELGGGKIAVAHNLNDQAETVLQRIIRGTGIDGLSAMSFINNDIIRPMLNVHRSEIEKYLSDNNYEFCTDHTNFQDIYGRNKIRLNLIPYLENNFNPNIQNVLYRMSEAMQGDKKIIEKYVSNKYDEVFIKKSQNEILLDLNKLKYMENFEVGRILRKAVEMLKGNTNNIEMKHIEYATEFVFSGNTGKKINLSEGIIAEISYNNLFIRKNIEITQNFKYNIYMGNPLFIKEVSKTILLKVMDISEYNPMDKNSVSLDYDLIKGNIIARNRQNGDSMIPSGMSGSKKLKDIFIDLKIPKQERDKIIIIADDNNILWVEKYRIHNNYKVSDATKKILNITFIKEQN